MEIMKSINNLSNENGIEFSTADIDLPMGRESVVFFSYAYKTIWGVHALA